MDPLLRYLQKVTLGALPLQLAFTMTRPLGVVYDVFHKVDLYMNDVQVGNARLDQIGLTKTHRSPVHMECRFEHVDPVSLFTYIHAPTHKSTMQMRIKGLPIFTSRFWPMWFERFDANGACGAAASGFWLELVSEEATEAWQESIHI